MPKSKSSPTQTPGAIAKADQFRDPFAQYGPASTQVPVKIPVAKIEYLANEAIQREHPDFKEGLFSINIGEQLPVLTVALVGLRYGRLLWPKEFDPKSPDRDPLCKSDDGITPSGGLECPKSAYTAPNGLPACVICNEAGIPLRNSTGRYIPACEFSKWGTGRETPPCREFFTLLLYEHTLNLPLVFSIKGTGIKHISQLRMDMIRFQRELPENIVHPPAAYTKIEISVLKVQRWYEPIFKIVGKFSQAEADTNAEAMRSIRPAFERSSSDDFRYDQPAEE
jgi:hypothetical protein